MKGIVCPKIDISNVIAQFPAAWVRAVILPESFRNTDENPTKPSIAIVMYPDQEILSEVVKDKWLLGLKHFFFFYFILLVVFTLIFLLVFTSFVFFLYLFSPLHCIFFILPSCLLLAFNSSFSLFYSIFLPYFNTKFQLSLCTRNTNKTWILIHSFIRPLLVGPQRADY